MRLLATFAAVATVNAFLDGKEFIGYYSIYGSIFTALYTTNVYFLINQK